MARHLLLSAGLIILIALLPACSGETKQSSEFAALSDVEVTFCSGAYGVAGTLYESLEDDSLPLQERLNLASFMDTAHLVGHTREVVLARKIALRQAFIERMNVEDLFEDGASGPGIIAAFSNRKPLDKERVMSEAEQRVADALELAEREHGPITIDNFLTSLTTCNRLLGDGSDG